MKEAIDSLESLAEHFDPTPFANGRDRVGLSAVVSALACDLWRKQFMFVWSFTSWLVGLMGWGTGCACHEAELRTGAQVSCPRKGRRLREAFAHVFGELDRILQVSNTWGEAHWGLGHQALMQMQGCVRGTVHLARRKFAWLGRLPYLLCRLDMPGVARESLKQWHSCAAADHHRVTRAFMSEDGHLRGFINDIRADGTGIDGKLQSAMDSLAAVPFDDSIAEGPHARMQRIARHSRRACWPWLASTMRLQQGLDDCRELITTTDADLDVLWCGYTSIIRVGGRGSYQAKKIKRSNFNDIIYRMSFCHEVDNADGDHGDAGDGGEGGDGADQDEEGGACDRGDAGDGVGDAGDNGSGDDPGDEGDGGGGGADVMRARVGPSKQELEMSKLLRQYLAASLSVHCVISIQAEMEEGDDMLMFFRYYRWRCDR
jgi:hypothetical protein